MKNPNRRRCYRYGVAKYDGPLRMTVPSRSQNIPPYLVQLDSYGCNGECQCKHFTCRLEQYLKRGVTPQQAVEQGFVEVPEWGTVEDALRCYHIHVARMKFADDVITAIHDANKTHALEAQRRARPGRPDQAGR